MIDGDCEARGAVATQEELSSTFSSTEQQTTSMQNFAGVTLNDSKWACKMCTYLNWPRSQRCVQCYTKKGAILETGSNEATIIAGRQQNFDSKALITNESFKRQELMANNVNNKMSLIKLAANIPTTSNNMTKSTDNIQGTTISRTKLAALPVSVSSSSNLEKSSNIYINATILNEESPLVAKSATTAITAIVDRTERSEGAEEDFINDYKKSKQSKQLCECIDETHISSSMIIASTTKESIAPTVANSNVNAKIQMTEQTTNTTKNNNMNMNMNNSNNHSNYSNNNHNHCISSSSSLSRCNSNNMDAEMNASNSAASAAAAAVMFNAERLSPLGAATAHMNLTVASMKQQQTNQQQLQQQQQHHQHYSNNQNQSNISNNQQNYHLSYMISKWSCNVSVFSILIKILRILIKLY